MSTELARPTKEWLPEDPETERALLGCLVMERGQGLSDVRRIVRPTDFRRAAHRQVYDAMIALADRDDRIDYRSVAAECKARDERFGRTWGGPELVVDLINSVPQVTHLMTYARRVRFLGVQWEVQGALNEMLHRLITRDAGDDPSKLLGMLMEPLEKIVTDRATGRVVTSDEAAHAYFGTLMARRDRDPAVVGLDTGFGGLDRYVAYRPGELWYVAAGPSAGKTAFLGTLADILGQRGVPALFVSIEQPLPQVWDRIMAARTSIDSWRLARGTITDEEQAALGQALEPVAKWPLTFLEHATITGVELDAQVQYAVARHGVKVVFVDYVQLLADNEPGEGMLEKVKSASAHLRRIARKHNICVVSASQVNKEDGLRWAQELQQDASVILLIKRELLKADAEIVIRKNRNGLVGPTLKCRFDFETAHFWPGPDQTMPSTPYNPDEIPL